MKSKIYKNFDLKKFIKLLQPQDFDNQKQIYLDFLQSCSTKKETANQIEERWSKSGFDELLYSMMETGKFFPYVSDNFKMEEKKSFEGDEFGNVMEGRNESITFFLNFLANSLDLGSDFWKYFNLGGSISVCQLVILNLFGAKGSVRREVMNDEVLLVNVVARES